MKRILLLGGTPIQIPIIEKAHEMGLYVITCDNKPDNPGHKLADEYHDISITDNEAVLRLAESLHVDAVVNFILEAGVQAAAYVHEKLGKPTSPYESVHILSNKKLFRTYLKEHGFCTPDLFTCSNKKEAYEKIGTLKYPVVVKPTDLWGSRGVSRVDKPEDFEDALDLAFSNSRGADIIVEKFIESDGAPVEGDAFAVDGTLATHVWTDVYSDPMAENPITPVCFCYPSAKPLHLLKKLDHELQRLITLLGMKTNGYNVEARIDRDGKVYLMEVAPRSGGNDFPTILSLSTGNDIERATLLAALGEDNMEIKDAACQGFWIGYIVHSNVAGTYQGMWYSAEFEDKYLYRFTQYISNGDDVCPYSGTNCSIGLLIARFDTRKEMEEVAQNPTRFFRPIIK